MAIIEVNDLVKRYGEHVAVDGVSFTVEKGEIFGILGPNSGQLVATDSPAGLVSRVDDEQRIRFRPSTPLDDAMLTALPEVPRAGSQIVVTGTGNVLHGGRLKVAIATSDVVKVTFSQPGYGVQPVRWAQACMRGKAFSNHGSLASA